LKRREFITLLGGAAVAFPLAASAQQRERTRRIGVLMNLASDDAEGQARLAAFLQGLQEAGWAVGRNMRIDLRWGGGDPESFRKQASELVALARTLFLPVASRRRRLCYRRPAPCRSCSRRSSTQLAPAWSRA
jgi:putative ABC transport system substrate-binding protein